MPETTEARLFDMLSQASKQATAERAALTRAFTDALAGLRWELRVLVLLLAAFAMARDGIMSTFSLPGVTIETRAATMPIPTAEAQELTP